MAIIHFRNALVLMNGTELTGALHNLTVEYSMELLDATVFGNDTRKKVGGLFVGKIAGKGFFDGAIGTEAVLWPTMGTDDTIFSIFPDGLTEGATSTGMGWGLKGAVATFALGGAVGTLLDISFTVEARPTGGSQLNTP